MKIIDLLRIARGTTPEARGGDKIGLRRLFPGVFRGARRAQRHASRHERRPPALVREGDIASLNFAIAFPSYIRCDTRVSEIIIVMSVINRNG